MFMFFFFFNEPATTEIYTYVHSFPTRLSSDLQDQVIEDEGADAVSDGEAAEEERGDRRPGEPIGPIEDRPLAMPAGVDVEAEVARQDCPRSEEHTSELQSLMRISYAVFCLKTKTLKSMKQNIQHTLASCILRY